MGAKDSNRNTPGQGQPTRSAEALRLDSAPNGVSDGDFEEHGSFTDAKKKINKDASPSQPRPTIDPNAITPKDPNVDIESAPSSTTTTAKPEEPLYSVFPRPTKLFIVAMATLGGFFSPFSTSIYFPAITPLASHFHVSTNLINLTITTYMVFQGVAPMLYADFADQAGRRPAFFATFVVYMGANVGLGVMDSYAALLVLRCLQSAGSSGTIALARGMLADVASPAERYASSAVDWECGEG